MMLSPSLCYLLFLNFNSVFHFKGAAMFHHHLLRNVPLCRFTLFTDYFRTVLVFVIVASYFGQSPVLLILRTAFSKLRHTHVALWPVSRVLVAFSFGF